ncbi:hypothetical protein ACFL2W_00560 [Candidatus Omnitrophota bacterium]
MSCETLAEILEKCSALSIYEKRQATREYGELVFYSKDRDEWCRALADILGPAIKPEGVEPTRSDQEVVKDYGGIRKDQTLFKKEYDCATVIAMFWPWQSGQYTTLKIGFLGKK